MKSRRNGIQKSGIHILDCDDVLDMWICCPNKHQKWEIIAIVIVIIVAGRRKTASNLLRSAMGNI
jgi:hypothetical protein